MAQASAAPGTPAGKSKGKILLTVLLVIVAVLAYFGINWYLDQHNYVSTDNAQVSGDILNASPRVPGKVLAIKVNQGDTVKKGDVLFTLDPEQFQAQASQAQALLDAAKAQLTKAEGGARSEEVAATQAGVDQAQAGYNSIVAGRDSVNTLLNDAQNNYNLLQSQMTHYVYPATGQPDAGYAVQQVDTLLANHVIDDAQYTVQVQAIQQAFAAQAQLQAQIDQLKGQLKTLNSQVSGAQAGLNGAKSKLSLVEAGASSQDLAVIEAQVRAAQATVDLAQLNASYAEVKAPADGTVAQVNVHAGDLVAPGQAAVSLVDLSKLQVTANVLETDVERIQKGQTVTLTIDAFPGKTFTGTVKQVGLATASTFSLASALGGSNASGNFTKVSQTVPVKINFDTTGQPVIPGMSVEAKIRVTK